MGSSTGHEVIGDPTMADALLDRLVHNAHKITLKGESMRRRKAYIDSEGRNDVT
jgi:DNA replication protein DnaC